MPAMGDSMKREELVALLEQPESQTLEWKADFPVELRRPGDVASEKGKGTLIKDLASMANGLLHGEGRVIYGVKDHRTRREIWGISRCWDDATFGDWIANAVEPPVNASYSEVEWEEDKRVGVFQISVHPDAPHVAVRTTGELHKGQVWQRVGTQNRVALHAELRNLFALPEPITLDNTQGSLATKMKAYYQQRGREVVFPRYPGRYDKLAEGYSFALFPGTRQQVLVSTTDKPELIAMLKPPKEEPNCGRT